MIKLKNIVKAYKSKKGEDTIALNNVSISFGNKGMTFILGKSGSGKSTLLNVIGGLDQYDSGEIILLGKSSKSFKTEDFDSYRNTYVGFVFQEFNLLEDYDVYENILLALQLQQREESEEKINSLLEKLELIELKNRKVNELSGGQKQRVAIARALIKEPKIILADEPTGNLDSKTSGQVMDLLKEISREKLVIVVTHDEESAALYGDRMIELKDGHVISDSNHVEDTSEGSVYQPIKSRLPFRKSFRLGTGSLKHRKIRLTVTVVLTMITLLFFGLLDTMSSVDMEKSHARLLEDSGEQFVQIEKYYHLHEATYDPYSIEKLEMTEDDQKQIEERSGKEGFPIYRMQDENSDLRYRDLLKIQADSAENNSAFSSFSRFGHADIVVVDEISSAISEKIIGREAKNGDEIVISNAAANLIINNGIMVPDSEDENGFETVYRPKDYEELINSNQSFYFGNQGRVKIVGVIDYDLSAYDGLIDQDYLSLTDEEIKRCSDFGVKSENVYNKIYVNKDFISNLSVAPANILNRNYLYNVVGDDNTDLEYSIALASAVKGDLEYYNGERFVTVDSLAENEIILDIRSLDDFKYQDYMTQLSSYLSKYPDEDQDVLEKRFFENYVKNYDMIGRNVAFEVYKTFPVHRGVTAADEKYENLRIVGLIGVKSDEDGTAQTYLSDELVHDLVIKPVYRLGYLVPVKTASEFEKILRDFPYTEELVTHTTYSETVISLDSTISTYRKIAFCVGTVFLVFTIILIANFMATSVNDRKKEIGILRALGARSVDVVKIFLWEGMIFTLISGTLSLVLLIVVSQLLTNVVLSWMIITPFIVGIRQVFDLYLVVLVVTMASSIIPILRISKKKPVDAILNQ